MKAAGIAALVLALGGCAALEMPAHAPIVDGLQCGPQQYPFQALQDYHAGQVVLRAEVAADGSLARGRVEQSSFDTYLDAGAIQALRQCRVHGHAPGSTVRVVVRYELMNGDDYLPRGVVTVLAAPRAPPPR